MTVRHQVLVNARLNDIEIPLQQEKIWKFFEIFTFTTDFKSTKIGKSEYDKRRSNGYIWDGIPIPTLRARVGDYLRLWTAEGRPTGSTWRRGACQVRRVSSSGTTLSDFSEEKSDFHSFFRFEKLEIESSEQFPRNFELRTALRMSAKSINRQSPSVRTFVKKRKLQKLPSSSCAVNVEICLWAASTLLPPKSVRFQ